MHTFSNVKLRLGHHPFDDYEPLLGQPAVRRKPFVQRSRWQWHRTERRTRLALSALAIFVIVVVGRYVVIQVLKPQLPPLYESHYRAETRLPQHNPELAFPEGREGRYVAMENIVISTWYLVTHYYQLYSQHGFQWRAGEMPYKSFFWMFTLPTRLDARTYAYSP